MASLNKVLLMGNLTRDPELRYASGSGTAFASFGLAVNKKVKKGEEWKDEVLFVDITVWAKQAETCFEYLNKGSLVFIEGRLNYQTWEDKQSGQQRSKLEVVANYVQFLSKPSGGAKPPHVSQEDDDAVPTRAPQEDDDDVPF